MYDKKAEINKITVVLLIAVILGGLFIFVHQRQRINVLKQALEESGSTHTESSASQLLGAQVKVNRPVMPRDKEVILAELQEVRAKLNKAEETIAEETRKKEILESQNQRLNREINSLKEELRLWEGKINNIDEKKLVLERRNRGTKELCQRIWDFKLKAQKEIDQIKMALGNQGYLTKTGKSTFSREKIVKLEKIVVTNQPKDRPANF